jgi:hypothetical protein
MKKSLILILLFAFSFIQAQEKALTKEKIMQLAETSAAASALLKVEYPHLFVTENRDAEDLTKIDVWNKFTWILSAKQRVPLIERVPGGIYAGKGFLLNDYWAWEIVRVAEGPVLVPFKRTVKI